MIEIEIQHQDLSIKLTYQASQVVSGEAALLIKKTCEEAAQLVRVLHTDTVRVKAR